MVRAWYPDRPEVLAQLRATDRATDRATPRAPDRRIRGPAEQSDRRELILEVQVRTVSEANTRGWHGRMRRAAEQRWLTWLTLSQHDLPRPPVSVRLVRLGPRALDDDNLASALKACRDGVADAYGLDDAGPLLRWGVAQEPGRRAYAVRIELRRILSSS